MSAHRHLLKWYAELEGMDLSLSEQPLNRFDENLGMEQTTMQRGGVIDKMMQAEAAVEESSNSRSIADACNTLSELEAAIRAFNGCSIKKGALNTVFADGNPNANLMLIGEAPGAIEDEQGIPFCGPSGQLLNNILVSIALKREELYITNTTFWRPPGNRRPTSEEIQICKPFVEKHVALVAPKLIILVGNTAVESLLGLHLPMHAIRDRSFDYLNCYMKHPIKTVVIFHPSYLLRQATKKKEMWFDMLKIKNTYLSS